ncbi:hypothetical protein CSUNSWCD_2359 [Campylobacter showae CSUNSWCD]|uniref:Uncharacterized protein n=1 Tax=Campylobacter showae CSUNSWCD TaxID=1244083 RepID=M5IQZ5_9BACT|nr:hypothetical protein CSUNSWCD_2359 [Campylobacter showae CSUNSWCD]
MRYFTLKFLNFGLCKFYLFCVLRYGGLYDYGVKFDCILGNNGIKVKAVGDFKIWIYGSEVKFG